MNEEQVDTIWATVAQYAWPVVAAIAIFVIGRWVSALIRKGIERTMLKHQVDETLVKFAGNLAYVLLMVAVIIAALNQVGIQTTSLIAVLGAAGLAVGLALQGSLSNFASGVMLIMFRPFKVGDFVSAGGEMGSVEEIALFTTQLKTPDNKAIIVPNAQITGGTITNFSAKSTRRIDLVIGVSYSDDLKQVKAVLNDMLSSDERILKDPEPTVGVVSLGESSVDFAVRPWVNAADYGAVYFDLLQGIKERFDAEGISIPFPQRDLHVIKSDADLAASA